MKNLHLLSTETPSRLVKIYNDVNRETFTLKLDVEVNDSFKEYINLYITSDEEIKEGECHLHYYEGKPVISKSYNGAVKVINEIAEQFNYKKIILTTDAYLINDGVQAIDDEFLQWFIKNTNCEEVKVVDVRSLEVYGSYYPYKIIIPKEEAKQENLEEAAERFYPPKTTDLICSPKLVRDSFIAGAKWKQEQNKNLYSEDDLLNFGAFVRIEDKKEKRLFLIQDYYKKWFNQLKKK